MLRNVACLGLCMVLLCALAPVAFGSNYDTEQGKTVKLNKVETSLQPSIDKSRDTKSYSLTADYTSGSKRGDLRCRSLACRLSTREESYGVHHLEMHKRDESKVTCGFGYRSKFFGSRVELRLYHKATVRNRCPISITVNGSTVVYDWSPRRTSWHTTTWRIDSYLREGPNEVVIRLGQAPKMYWLKRIEVSSGSDCLFRNSTGIGTENETVLRRLMEEARRAYDDGTYYARRHEVRRARGCFDDTIKKCRRIERGSSSSRLRRKAADLRRDADYELRKLNTQNGDERYRRVFRDANDVYRRAQSLPLYDGIRLYKRVIRMCDDIVAHARDRDLKRRARDLRQRAWYALPAADRY